MKLLILFFAFIPLISLSQEENEILRVSALRARFDKIMDVKVYPNPTSDGRITIHGEPGTAYQIFNLSGSEVQFGSIEQESVFLDHLQTGTYILLLKQNGVERREKLIVL